MIAGEPQAHGRTADIDRPLTMAQLADDVAALLHQIGIDRADFFGFRLGAGIGLEIAIRRPEIVRMLVLAAVT